MKICLIQWPTLKILLKKSMTRLKLAEHAEKEMSKIIKKTVFSAASARNNFLVVPQPHGAHLRPFFSKTSAHVLKQTLQVKPAWR